MSDHGDEDARRPASPVSSYMPFLCDETLDSDLSDKRGSSKRRVIGKLKLIPPHCRWTGFTYRPTPGELSQTQCEQLVSLLKNKLYYVKELDLSKNFLKKSLVERLCAALESPHCTLKTLRLSDCILSERCVNSLVSAIKLNRSNLMELDLSGNKYLRDSGVNLLSAGLRSQYCRLRTLRLVCCGLTESSCAALCSALKFNFWLEELDLSENHLQDSGVNLLCAGLKTLCCMLRTLRLSSCNLSDNSCAYLALTMKSRRSFLRELDLSLNKLHDSGMKFLSVGLKSHYCHLKTLRLSNCLVSDKGCAALVSALKSKPSDLIELDLSGNKLQDQGMSLLSALVESPLCKLKTLRVDYGRNLITTDSHEKCLTPEPKQLKSQIPMSTGKMTRRFLQKSEGKQLSPRKQQQQQIIESLQKLIQKLKFKQAKLRAEAAADDYHATLKKTAKEKNTTEPNKNPEENKDVMKTTSCFTPQVSIIKSGEIQYSFRVQYPGTYQCGLTQLVFSMIREGELSYRVIQWDERLLQSAGKTPAGPLFNIQCSEDAVSQLHIPHCETERAAHTEGLSVVHISDDGMSILKPLCITDTHVVVDVPCLSAFGLALDFLKSLWNKCHTVRGQVLLFHRLRTNRKLNVFLLPENVPLQEVKGQQEGAEHCEASSSCSLVKGQEYSVLSPEAYRIQPASARFDFNYGPNYHPTFVIQLTPSTVEANVTVQDQEKTEEEEKNVWTFCADFAELVSASSSALPPASEPGSVPVQAEERASASRTYHPPTSEPASLPVPAEGEGPGSSGQTLSRTQSLQGEEEKKVFSVRTEFINRVSNPVIKDLLDNLLQKKVINSREMESIQQMPRADKAQELIDMVLRKGNPACKILIDTLCESDEFLSKTLQLK